jgi:ATP-binding protein involved in chromosome partitioning
MISGLRQVKNLIAIGAGKGGVGKSTSTVMLALALKKKGYKVGIVDLDLYGPSIGKMFKADIIPTPYENGMLPAIACDIKLMSIAYFKQGLDVNFVRAPIANGILQQFLHLVEWGDLDYLLIDCPPGTGDILMTLMQEVSLTAAILVTTPQEVALLDVRKAYQMFMKMNVCVLGIIENMCYYEVEGKRFYPFGLSKLAVLQKEYRIESLGQIPLTDWVCEFLDQGISNLSEENSLFDLFDQIARQLVLKLEQLAKIDSLELIWEKNL